MEYVLIIGIAVLFNFLLLKYKIEDGRWADASVDLGAMLCLSYIFGGTLTGMAITMVGGLLISIALYFFPPNLNFDGGSKHY